MTTFRPSARLRLTLRTEDFAETDELEARLPPASTPVDPYAPPATPEPPRVPAQLTSEDVAVALGRNEAELRALNADREYMSKEEYEGKRQRLLEKRQRIQSANILRVLEPFGLAPPSVASPVDDLTVIGDIEPLGCTIERNGLATADGCSITIDFADAPFDPRILRAAHVDLLIGVVPADDFEAGMDRGVKRADGSLVSIVGKGTDGELRGATRFVGFVDEWQVKYDDDGDTVTLECRDMSAPLRDQRLFTGQAIDLTLPIDQGIGRFFDTIPSMAGVLVRYEGEGDPPTPAAAAKGIRQPRRGRVVKRARKGAQKAGQEMSAWDHVTDVCGSIGFIPQVRDYGFVIAEARTLFATEGVRRMVYGQNLQKLGFTRRLAGVKVPTIEVRAYDPELGRTRWARYPVRAGERSSGVLGLDNPPRPLRANEVSPSGANPTEQVRVIEVSKVTDPETLRRVARNTSEQIGRQEIEGVLETSDVHSYDREPDEADLLNVFDGDPIEILVVAAGGPGTNAPVSTLADLQALSRAARADYLRSLGWPDKVARRFAQLQEANGFQTVFRAQDIRIDFDQDDGLKIAVNFINYITVREGE